MAYVLDFIGFVRAWLTALGPEGLVLVGLFGFIFWWTRKRPGRHHDRLPPPVPENREGWWFTG